MFYTKYFARKLVRISYKFFFTTKFVSIFYEKFFKIKLVGNMSFFSSATRGGNNFIHVYMIIILKHGSLICPILKIVGQKLYNSHIIFIHSFSTSRQLSINCILHTGKFSSDF